MIAFADWVERVFVDSYWRRAYFRAVELPLLARIPVPENPSVLEIGAGTGMLTPYLKKLWRPRLHVAIDLEPRGRGVIAADATRLPFADKAFDIAVELCCFHHIPHYRRAIREAVRVSKCFVYEDFPWQSPLFRFFACPGPLTRDDFPGRLVGRTHTSFLGYAENP